MFPKKPKFAQCLIKLKRRLPVKKLKGWFDSPSVKGNETLQLITDEQLDKFYQLQDCLTVDCAREPDNTTSSSQPRFRIAKSHSPKALRKEYRMLTDSQRQAFHAALKKLKTTSTGAGALNDYDAFVAYHQYDQSPSAHFGTSFLPFHRQYLNQLELMLRLINPSVALPYYDSSLDSGLPDPGDAIIWSDDFLGPAHGFVDSGSFAGWTVGDPPKPLVRSVSGIHDELYNINKINYGLSRTRFHQLTYCIDPTFEELHGSVHEYVGGHMNSIPVAPGDPVFFMHHAFVDYLWEQFRQRRQSRWQRENDYPGDNTVATCFNPDFYARTQMRPFSIRNIDGLSNSYTDEAYSYSGRPSCSFSNLSCGSKYLFCHHFGCNRQRSPVCLSKIKIGGDCTGFQGTDICYGGFCGQNNKCQVFSELEADFVPVARCATSGR